MFCQTCKQQMSSSMMPCPICEATSLHDVNMAADERYEFNEEVASDKMMHGEGFDAIDEEVTSQFTVSVDDLKNRNIARPPEGMKFYAGDEEEDIVER